MTSRRLRQGGFGLLEMIIGIVVLSLVLASTMGVLIHQQRFYTVAADVAETASTLQGAKRALAPDLLPLDPAAGDIVLASPDSLALRVFRGVFSVCEKRLNTDVFITVRRLISAPTPLFLDSALVYSQGTKASIDDDRWIPIKITSVQADACPDGTAAWTGVVKGLGGILSQVPVGAPLRVFQHASYWLASENGRWFVKTDALGGAATAIAGPLAPSDSAASSILQFRYLDASGAPTATLTAITDIQLDGMAVGDVPMRRGGTPYSTADVALFKLRNTE